MSMHNVRSPRSSYQLEADFPTPGSDIGALVHFTEEQAGDNVTTLTPWIAMIECRNWTHASDYWDVFTLARDRGARAAVSFRPRVEDDVEPAGGVVADVVGILWGGIVALYDNGAELFDQSVLLGRV